MKRPFLSRKLCHRQSPYDIIIELNGNTESSKEVKMSVIFWSFHGDDDETGHAEKMSTETISTLLYANISQRKVFPSQHDSFKRRMSSQEREERNNSGSSFQGFTVWVTWPSWLLWAKFIWLIFSLSKGLWGEKSLPKTRDPWETWETREQKFWEEDMRHRVSSLYGRVKLKNILLSEWGYSEHDNHREYHIANEVTSSPLCSTLTHDCDIWTSWGIRFPNNNEGWTTVSIRSLLGDTILWTERRVSFLGSQDKKSNDCLEEVIRNLDRQERQ